MSDVIGEVACRACEGTGRDVDGFGGFEHCARCNGTGRKAVARPPQIACGDLPDPSGLLAWVIADPDEDTHRLVYADWLEENGQPGRAEYIRLWLGARDRSTDERLVALWRSLFEPPLAWQMKPRGRADMVFMDRGFIRRIECTWDLWCEGGDALRALEWAPTVKLATEPILTTDGTDYCLADLVGDARGVWHTPRPGEDPRHALCEARWPGTAFSFPNYWPRG